MRAWFIRTLSGCVASDAESLRILSKFPLGTTFECEVNTRQARSGQWHRKYWALLGQLAEHVTQVNIRELNDDGPPVMFPVSDSESLHTAMKFICGLCEKYTIEAGNETHIVRVPKSTAFDKMTPDEWSLYWPKVLDAIHQRVLPAVDYEFLRDELARMAS